MADATGGRWNWRWIAFVLAVSLFIFFAPLGGTVAVAAGFVVIASGIERAHRSGGFGAALSLF